MNLDQHGILPWGEGVLFQATYQPTSSFFVKRFKSLTLPPNFSLENIWKLLQHTTTFDNYLGLSVVFRNSGNHS